ncbi:ABC transporter-like protein (plasmid) [Deinococcus gobiensis I-0]|uniref:ABC transporter-like protein n=2 Tax=Deinococcus TaxID=1298 RepID=H8H0R8_DEIGI|nr:ABC transporter-like protein [Deinococcus gobiensis I-0]
MTMSDLQFPGFHHLTAVSANIRENKRFYTQDLGMRLIKRSVNQDDVSAYHLFYADAVGTPGTDVTFFDWPVDRERRGNHSVTRTALRVRDEASLGYWQARLDDLKVTRGEVGERAGRATLDFEDPEGQRLSLVVDGGAGDEPTPWAASPVPAEHQIRGLGPITMTVPSLRNTDLVLQKVMNMRPVREYADPESPAHTVHVYEMGAGGPQAELHVAVRPDLPPAQSGAGGVHHVAFRTPDDEQYHAWNDRLNRFGLRSSGEVDRYYFRSLYFREPNGVLFEIATDGPGFGVDEDMATLGDKVILPPRFEPRRAQILAGLKPID